MKAHRFRIASAVAVLAFASIVTGACSSSPPPMTMSMVTGPVTLSPGDSIRISVWRGEQFSGQFGIAADGTIAHPMYKDVRAADIPLSDLDVGTLSSDADIKRALAGYLEVPDVKFRDYTIDRHETGNLTVRPEAVFG